MAVSIRWTGLLDWTTGLDYWTRPNYTRSRYIHVGSGHPNPISHNFTGLVSPYGIRWPWPADGEEGAFCRVGSTTDRAKPVNPCFSGAMELYRSPLLEQPSKDSRVSW